MRTFFLLSSLIFFAAACAPPSNSEISVVDEQSQQSPSLLDIVSPDEVVEELGLPPMSTMNFGTLSLAQHNRTANIDLTKYFPVVIVINKANRGPTAQTMKVYHRGQLAHQFPVSTGREMQENSTKSGRVYFSTTPTGWFAPTRTYEKYFSELWEAWMNNSVFFNGGIAMHATTKDHFKELGQRASGGCVRLHPTNAKIVYDLVLGEGKGQVPVYTRDGQISYEGIWKKRVKLEKNWNTLIIVEENELE
jgi:hypothetical protein